MKTERQQFKAILKKDYPDGKKPEIGGYCSYFFQREDGSIYRQWLSSGVHGSKWPIPSKYYKSWKEIYKEGKLYFNKK